MNETGLGDARFSALATMRGEAVLSLTRDILTNEAARVRSFEEQLIGLGLSSRINPARLAVILGLEASADVITHLIAAGQGAVMSAAEAKAAGRQPPVRVQLTLEMAAAVADQARVALMAGDVVEEHREGAQPDDDAA
jgi:hypothetical protein